MIHMKEKKQKNWEQGLMQKYKRLRRVRYSMNKFKKKLKRGNSKSYNKNWKKWIKHKKLIIQDYKEQNHKKMKKMKRQNFRF